MWDMGCIVASVAFFLIAIAYTTGCERLGTKEGKWWRLLCWASSPLRFWFISFTRFCALRSF